MEKSFQDAELTLAASRSRQRHCRWKSAGGPGGRRPVRVRRGQGRFASLGIRNYRLYFSGQMVSMAGTWMQQVAQALLVLQLTHDGTTLGLVVTLQMVPTLLLTVPAGPIVDRVPRRSLIIGTQTAYGVTALTLGLLTATGAIELWMVYTVALCCGTIQAIDDPARQAFVSEMVGKEHLANAVSLNGVMVNLARIVGPALAGVFVVTAGVAVCFLVNALSYVGVIVALLLIRRDELLTVPPTPHEDA